MTLGLGFILFRFPLLPVRVGPGTAQIGLICDLTVEKPFCTTGREILDWGGAGEGQVMVEK